MSQTALEGGHEFQSRLMETPGNCTLCGCLSRTKLLAKWNGWNVLSLGPISRPQNQQAKKSCTKLPVTKRVAKTPPFHPATAPLPHWAALTIRWTANLTLGLVVGVDQQSDGSRPNESRRGRCSFCLPPIGAYRFTSLCQFWQVWLLPVLPSCLWRSHPIHAIPWWTNRLCLRPRMRKMFTNRGLSVSCLGDQKSTKGGT